MAEWLGSGLQNHVQRFESARYLGDNARLSKQAFFIAGSELRTDFSLHPDLSESLRTDALNVFYLEDAAVVGVSSAMVLRLPV